MNCKNVEELLPLYVGRDLEESRTRLITSHLQACRECARSAEEYGEATQLLQLFEPPQFSEATYRAMRSRVLREIERESNTPHTMFALKWIRRPFQPRVMWAVSTAVLLAVCLFAYYFVANRTNGPREQAEAGSKPDRLIDTPVLSGMDRKPAHIVIAEPPAIPRISQRPRSKQTAWHSRRAGGTPAVPVIAAQYSLAEGPKHDPTNSPSAASDKTLRLEIQTSNPNIRIIWFSQPANNQGSPNESSKGI